MSIPIPSLVPLVFKTRCGAGHNNSPKTPLDASSGVGFIRRFQPQFNKTRPYLRLGLEPKYFDYQSNACTNSATLAKSEINCCNGLECRAKERLYVISSTAWVGFYGTTIAGIGSGVCSPWSQ